MKTPDGLKPCGCGGRPAVNSEPLDGAYWVMCSACWIATAKYDTPEGAKDAWNKALGG